MVLASVSLRGIIREWVRFGEVGMCSSSGSVTTIPATFTSIEMGSFVAKWDLDGWRLMQGRVTARVIRLLEELRKEELL
jgi:hypothetical protein